VSQQRIVRLFLALLVLGAPVPLSAQNGVEETARRAAAAMLRPGDRIELSFQRDRDLNSAVNVDERGEAVFPKIGTLQVSSTTIGGLSDTLRTRYSEFLRNPELQVTVLRRVVVNGEVRLPSVYMLDLTSSVRDAIARAGGLLETSNKNKVYVVRDGKQRRVANWDSAQGPETDLLSGDQVVVGRKSWLTLNALPVISTSVIVVGLIQSLRRN
jgi:protein involved in polysaccharide export with SLBB domain